MKTIRPPRLVPPFFGCIVAVLLMLLPATASATNTITAFGLTFEANPGASLEYGLCVYNENFVEGWEGPSPTNFGARVFLGEAQHGLFCYPDATFETDSFSMDNTAYGSINGETNQQISYVRGIRNGYANYTIDVDLSALRASQLAYSVFNGNELVDIITDDCGECSATLTADFSMTWWASPRVNPYWVEACGDAGVMIEFSTQADVTIGHGYTVGYANRIFIQAVNPTATVDYVSQVDVTASGVLQSFTIWDARLAMFHRGHKALGDVVMDARGGTLTLTNILYWYSPTNGEEPPAPVETGVAIELDNGRDFGNFGYIELLDGAGRFDLSLEPVDLSEDQSWVYLTSNGLEREGEGLEQGDVLGSVRLLHDSAGYRINAQLATDSVLWSFYSQGQFVGSMLMPVSCPGVVNGNPRLLACGVNANSMSGPAGYTMRFDQPVTFDLGSTSDLTNTMTGDEIHMGAVSTSGGATNAAPIASFQGFVLLAQNTPSITITNEFQQQALMEVPTLAIEQVGTNVVISWLDPNRVFFLESSTTPDSGPFFWVESPVAYANNIATVTVPVTTQNQIFRLNAHQIRRPRPGVD